ncbi:Glyoxalase/Bleomycin resistance protein/Dihydroxybiphenyl dioxygenase [Xylariaceae sp. FL0662B]|nr:Glyoxalase/Bleomycin resistance protein/Dihydroxybiphenyl dioxygenase [Xylariaceae sp. FL0662B]
MTDSTVSGKVLSPARLAHFVLRTPRFKAMNAFYKAFLGAHASHESETLAFLTYDEEHHRIALLRVSDCGDKVRNSAGLEHVAFAFDTLGDLCTAYAQRRARGILPIWCVNHGPTTSMYYQDPDGNTLETQVDNFDTSAQANAYMASAAFAENPMGVDFDPEDLIARLESGEPEADIKKRPDIGPRGLDSIPLLSPPQPVVRDSYEPLEAGT